MTLELPARVVRLTALAALIAANAPTRDILEAQQIGLVPTGAVWKYLDNGSNQGTAWRAIAVNDSTWKSGLAELGYGDGDEATTVGYGPNASAKYITTYFRHRFSVSNPASFKSLVLRIKRDDGAVVYLNGTEVFRTNMPAGAVSNTTLASAALGGSDETTYVSATLNPALLVAGTNALAVEVHQANATSSDLSFDLSLTAGQGVLLTRGPYLQLGTPSTVLVKWRTSAPVVGTVQYGATPGATTWEALESTAKIDHKVALTGLMPNTTYYYSVGSPEARLAGGDSTFRFTTSPSVGTVKPTRIWVLGDSGTANANARAVRDAYYAYTGSRRTDLWLMLGDNAYQNGTDAEYQAAVFDMYPTMLRSSVLWPTLGNHDGYSASSSTLTGPYYTIFTLPRAGEAGGLASGTEAYYSFDYSNIHFVCLDSFGSSRLPGSPMLTWLDNDLAATQQAWVVVFFHHPPYSKGSHDSDVDVEMVQMRQNVLPILENAGVDLVLTGHSHSYERSFLLDGHYGPSSTFSTTMKKNGGSGREDGSGAYRKPTVGSAPHEGAVYAVAGSSGQTSGGALNHPAMYISLNSLGSMVLDVSGNRLDAAFIDAAGARKDYFTILKGTTTVSPPAAPSGLTATGISAGWIRIRWVDNATNEDGFEIQRSRDNVTFFTVTTVGANTTLFNDTGLSRTTKYFYRVRAYRGSPRVPSGWSNVASATTPST
jgi:phosphodiesterase/alkaline phosphatase D-like protein